MQCERCQRPDREGAPYDVTLQYPGDERDFTVEQVLCDECRDVTAGMWKVGESKSVPAAEQNSPVPEAEPEADEAVPEADEAAPKRRARTE